MGSSFSATTHLSALESLSARMPIAIVYLGDVVEDVIEVSDDDESPVQPPVVKRI